MTRQSRSGPNRLKLPRVLDSALLQAAGVETVVCGAAGAGAHSGEEWVDVESVLQLAEILARAAVEYCA